MALITRVRRAWQVLNGFDYTAGVVGLPPEQVRRLGALTLQEERSEAVEHYVMEQRQAYEEANKEDLIETLLSRDRQLMAEGRRLADGLVGNRILREFMRASLYAAEGKASAQMVERVLATLGADPADARQLRAQGSTLGRLEDPEQCAKTSRSQYDEET